jgi:hypothetical protein
MGYLKDMKLIVLFSCLKKLLKLSIFLFFTNTQFSYAQQFPGGASSVATGGISTGGTSPRSGAMPIPDVEGLYGTDKDYKVWKDLGEVIDYVKGNGGDTSHYESDRAGAKDEMKRKARALVSEFMKTEVNGGYRNTELSDRLKKNIEKFNGCQDDGCRDEYMGIINDEAKKQWGQVAEDSSKGITKDNAGDEPRKRVERASAAMDSLKRTMEEASAQKPKRVNEKYVHEANSGSSRNNSSSGHR